MFNVSEELNELSEIFNKNKKTLYIVGGYVRNKIIGIADYENLDIDLCSSAKPLEVENLPFEHHQYIPFFHIFPPILFYISPKSP